MDTIEIAPDPPPPASLTILLDVESVLPGVCLPATALLQYKFPDPFTAPHSGVTIPVWSGLPPHDVRPALLGCPVPERETVEQLLLDVRQLTSTPRSGK